jgi:mono/diheme cytochrome c family protein
VRGRSSAPRPHPHARPSSPSRCRRRHLRASPLPARETAAASDTPPAGGEQPADQGSQGGPQKASLNATPEEYQGWKQFSANCERCHGQDALGSSLAPDLRKSINQGSVLGTGKLTHDLFIGTVVAGRPAKGMPTWGPVLSKDQMEQIWAYLNARASGKLAAGRPVAQGS